MSGASKSNHEQNDKQREVLSTDWWRTIFNNVSWSYPASQGCSSRHYSKRTTLLRISQANGALKSRITKYLKGDHVLGTLPEELNRDLAGVKVVEEALEPYEMDAGFSMLDNVYQAMDTGWIPDKFPLADDEVASGEYRHQWEVDVRTLLGDIYESARDDERVFPDITPEEGEEGLKDLSPLWDSCLTDVSIIDLVHSADLIDLTDSELSADSDPLPMTPRAGKYSLSALSPASIKPLSATASSFVPSPANFNSFRSPPSSSPSPSPSPSPPMLDIVNFPTLRQTILPPSRKDDYDTKSKWLSKRQCSVVPSFLTEKADSGSRRSKTRQMVDKMRSASDARKPGPDFIPIVDDRPTTAANCKPMTDGNMGSPKANKKRTRRGRESISTVSTDNASIRSSSAEGSGSNQHPFTSLTSSRHGTRPSSKHSKRTCGSSMGLPLTVQTSATPVFSSPAASVSSFGAPVTPASFGLPYPPPPHHAFMHMGGRTPSFPPPFPYPYYSGMPGGGMMPPPAPFGHSYQIPYSPYSAYGKGVITGSSGIRHASW